MVEVINESYTNLSSADSVSASDLRARIALEWFEAIAIAQAASGDGFADRSLSPDDVFISADGHVSATRKSRGDASDLDPVHRVARLVRYLLPDAFPMPLRLALTQAMSTPPFYESLTEFSDALKYFERPNRAAVIQAVYQRWKNSAAPAHAAGVMPERDLDLPPASLRKARRPLPIKRLVQRGLVVLGVAVVAAVIVWGFSSNESTAGLGANLVQRTTVAVDSMLDRVLPTPAPQPAAESQKPVASPPPSAPASPSTKKPVAGTDEVAGLAAQITAFDLREPPAVLAVSSPVEPPARSITASSGQVDARIYSETDSDVAPPVATYPRLPSILPAGTEPRDLAVIELVIAPSGRVDTVKLRRAPTSISDSMLLTMSLSAAKTWRFDPATKDGQPVRYRKSIWLVMH
jgi:hypothetical protein